MDRADKIFTAMSLLGLAGFLLWQRSSVTADTTSRVNASATPAIISDTGPAYLLSALPARRRIDDYAAPVSA